MIGPAMCRLVEDHQWLVQAIAREQRRVLGGDIDDLIGDGMVGLVEAADRFNPALGVPFDAYVRPRVRGAIVDGYRRANRTGHHHSAGPRVRLMNLDSCLCVLPSHPAVDDEAIARVRLARVLQAIGQMKAADRAVLGIAMAEPKNDGGLFVEHARRTGVTAEAVATRLYTARRKLGRLAA